MTGTIELRAADPVDFAMAIELYLSAMQPFTAELMIWDETKQRASCAMQWKVEDVQIIVLENRDVGWIQTLETDSEVVLQQFFIAPGHQGRGLGSQVLQRLLDRWRA